MKTIGQRIRNLRKQSDLSQEKVAELIGKTKSNVSGYENDKFEPSAKTIMALCKLFNVSSDWLLFGKENGVLKLELNDELNLSSKDITLLSKIKQLGAEERIKIEGIIDGIIISHDIQKNKKLLNSMNGEEAATSESETA